MRITRRNFLRGAAAGATFGPSLFGRSLVQQALASNIGNRFLVNIFLDGGIDGFNTIVPVDDGGGSLRTAYDDHRHTGNGGLNLDPGVLLPVGTDPNTGATLGFHPALAGLHHLHTSRGRVAIVQGCGYPEYSLSHEVSANIWHSGNPLGAPLAGGWLGRNLERSYGASDVPAVGVDWSLPGELQQSATSVLTIKRLEWFGWPHDWERWWDRDSMRDTYDQLYATAAGSAFGELASLGATGGATLVASEAYPDLDDLYTQARPSWEEQYRGLGTSLGRDFGEVAKMIHGVSQGVPNVNARYFSLRQGGYDTHSDQGGSSLSGRHGSLLAELGDGLRLFYEDLEDMGLIDDVLVTIFSEFGRRAPQNDSGTDHGSQGPMFLIGGKVQGGLSGNHPNLEEAALDEDGNPPYSQDPDDPFRSIDFRDVQGHVLESWVGLSRSEILTHILPVDPGPAETYWTSPDFDRGIILP